MTETLNRPPRPSLPPRSASAGPARGRPGPGAAAALWAATAGLLCVVLPALLVWATDSRSGSGALEAVRSAGRLWLLAHGASLEVPGGRVELTPIGLMLLPLALVARFTAAAAREASPQSVGTAASLALWTAGPYAVLVSVVAAACTGPHVHVSPVQSLLAGSVVGVVGAGLGVLWPGRLWRDARPALPGSARRVGQAAGAATALLVGAGALLVGGSLAVHLGRALDLAGAGDPGAAGGFALLLTGLALVPNAALWGVAWLSGPGFAVGVGTGVGPFGHDLGPVPSVPLLAALPETGLPGWLGVLVLLVPLLAGAVAGRLVLPGASAGQRSMRRTALEAALVGPLCGAMLGVLAWMSGGAVGGDRLVQVGPSPWRVAFAVAAAVGAGAVAAALLRHRRAVADPA